MKVFLWSIITLLCYHPVVFANESDSLLNVLKSEINRKQYYDGQKQHHIIRLKRSLGTITHNNLDLQYTICDQLYEQYKDFIFDSAHVYAQKLLILSQQLHSVPKQYESRIKLSTIQLSWGMFKETFDNIRQINVRVLPDSIKVHYYELKSIAYTSLSLYNTDKFYITESRAESIKALDSALMYSKPESYEKYRHTAERLRISGREDEAAYYYRKLLKSNLLSTHQRAMVSNDLSNLLEGPETIKLITEAAIFDIKSSTKETLAIYTLGNLLFSRGRIADAELLLKEALEQAQFYGNRLHVREIIAVLTTLSGQKLIRSETTKNHTLSLLIVLLILAILSVVLVSLQVYKRLKEVKKRELDVKLQNRYLDNINKRLIEDTRIKEEYIGYFFDVISKYILKLEKIKRNTERKVKAQNYEELIQIVNEIDIKQERHNLFYTFDNTFLKLFPNFITRFNSMLKPEDQIWPKHNEVLNTNLRIFALLRLGIKDNQTIANILESSVSTIYTYRKRVKSKVLINGEDFENKIMEIQFADDIEEFVL
jgi:tetratricopeptide (TPR) repeat protein